MPVFRSQKLSWSLVGIALVLAVLLLNFRGDQTRPGDERSVPISLITADRDTLFCALSAPVGRYRCAFSDESTRVTVDGGERFRLAPYMSTGGELLLIPGLFLDPAVQARYDREPPRGRSNASLRRFTATCRLRFVELVSDVRVRWGSSGGFGAPTATWVAEPVGCKTDG